VLYEMASGRRPFREDLPTHLIDDILHKIPEPPKKSDGKPNAFEAVISRCLAKEAAHRFQTAKEVMAELEAFGVGGASKELRPRQARLETGIGVAALAAVALIGIAFRSNLRGALVRLGLVVMRGELGRWQCCRSAMCPATHNRNICGWNDRRVDDGFGADCGTASHIANFCDAIQGFQEAGE